MACRVGDCFNNVQKKYLKINRALFNELKYRIKDQDWTVETFKHKSSLRWLISAACILHPRST